MMEFQLLKQLIILKVSNISPTLSNIKLIIVYIIELPHDV